MTVTFFGHADAPQEIEQRLESALADLIANHGAATFYVGNQGNFDRMARKALEKLKTRYPQITCTVVLAYMPGAGRGPFAERLDTIYPEGLENTPKRFAITKRNLWLIEHSDMVVAYVRRSFGGAARFKEMAERKGKPVLNIADLP